MIKLVTNQKKFYNSFDIISVDESLHILESMSQISCDTETSGYDFNTKELLLTQIGNKDVQIVIDNTSISLQHYKGILENKPSIWQNFQFDGRFLYKYDIYPKKIYDTLIAEAILLSGLGDESDIKDVKDAFNKKIADKFISRSLGLDAIVEKYCGVMLNKSIRGEINKIGVTDRVIKYAAGDVKYLEEVQEKQMSKIHEYTKKYNIDGDIIDLEMNATLAITRMCYNGVKLDADKYRKEVINKVIKNLNDSIHKLDSEVLKEPKLKKWHFVQGNLFFQDRRTEINWNSYKQKMEILPLLDPTITSTGAQEIRKRSDKHPIFPVILDYNKAKKLESSFGESLLKHINTKSGRIHPSVWQVLATGRISMSDPNLLQIPGKGELAKTIRSCFILEKGNKFVGGDYSSFELTVIAEFSQDPLWIDTLNAGENLHTVLCSETFDISQDKVNDPFPYNKDMTYRAVQKTIDFGLA